jgi:hypothetical protein
VQYNSRVDEIIVESLMKNGKMSYLNLKRGIEKVLFTNHDRQLSKSVYKFHLDKLLKEKTIHKEDSGIRGKEVHYSLTADVRKKRQHSLLGIDPNQTLLRKIYAGLFSKLIVGSSFYCYEIDNLKGFLTSIGATKNDLEKKHTNYLPLETLLYNNYATEGYRDPFLAKIKMLSSTKEEWHRLAKIINYEPLVSGRRLFQLFGIDYDSAEVFTAKGTFIFKTTGKFFKGNSKKPREFTAYSAILPGISIDDFIDNKQSYGNYERQDIEYALNTLSKEGLIKAIRVFHGKPRYVVADEKLGNMIVDLNKFYCLELRFLEIKWNYYAGPTEEEQERLKLYLDQPSCKALFQQSELMRNEFQRMEQSYDNKEFIDAKNELSNHYDKLKHKIDDTIKNLREKHATALQRYEFLHDVIRMICPAVLQ